MFNLALKSVSFHRRESSSYNYLPFRSRKNFFFFFIGSISLDPSVMRSSEDNQVFIDLFSNSPTLNAVNIITCRLLQMESNEDQWLKEQGPCAVASFTKLLLLKQESMITEQRLDLGKASLVHSSTVFATTPIGFFCDLFSWYPEKIWIQDYLV